MHQRNEHWLLKLLLKKTERGRLIKTKILEIRNVWKNDYFFTIPNQHYPHTVILGV